MDVACALWYLERRPLYETTKPYVVNLPLSSLPAGTRTNQACCLYPGLVARDMRSAARPFTLDANGFELTTAIPLLLAHDDFRDPHKVKDVYCQHVKTALMRSTGAELGFVVHHAVRRRHHSFPEKARGSQEADANQPVQGVHCDFTPLQAYRSLQTAVGDRAAQLWGERRIQIIQVWRPLGGPVTDWPLGVCDSTSVSRTSDLIATDNVWSYTVSETYNVFHSPKHIWYFVHAQTSKDVLLFKGFDSRNDVASFCAHASFQLEGHVDGAPMRESVECAVLLVHPKDTGEGETGTVLM